MVVLITWIQFCKDLMGCLPGSSIGLTLNMFAHVASSYIKVIACFAPFLLAFSYTFHAIAHGEKEFMVNFMDALFKTLVMAIGELEGWDKIPALDVDRFETSEQKWTLYLGRMCLMAFVFLFTVVLLNLLNAIAIGDVQELREDATIIRNRARIVDLLHQKPATRRRCVFDNPSERRGKYLIDHLLEKGRFGHTVEKGESASRRPHTVEKGESASRQMSQEQPEQQKTQKDDQLKVFLPQSTVRSIKNCLRTDEMTKKDTNQLKDLDLKIMKIMKVVETNSKILDTMNPKNGKIDSDSDSDSD